MFKRHALRWKFCSVFYGAASGWSLDQLTLGARFQGMIALPQQFQGGTYLTVTEAASFMGCSVGWVRMLILQGKLEATRVGNRTLLIAQAAAQRAKDGLTSRSLGKKEQAKRPAATRKPAKRAAKGRARG